MFTIIIWGSRNRNVFNMTTTNRFKTWFIAEKFIKQGNLLKILIPSKLVKAYQNTIVKGSHIVVSMKPVLQNQQTKNTISFVKHITQTGNSLVIFIPKDLALKHKLHEETRQFEVTLELVA